MHKIGPSITARIVLLTLTARLAMAAALSATTMRRNVATRARSASGYTRLRQSSSSSSACENLSQQISGQMILAPLTKGGNLPFRRLCADFGMQVSMSEMVYSRYLLKGEPIERARLRRAPNEQIFVVQIATNQIEEGSKAIALAAESGADFVDLNCGCPIHDATRRGLGSALLTSPPKLGKLVNGLVQAGNENNIPVTVKIRLGYRGDDINVRRVVTELREAGAAAVTIHGRTAQQGYKKTADWDLIRQVVEDGNDSCVPVVGNGDISTHYEARRRMEESGVDSVMVGRAALTKPWIFGEFRDGKDWDPDMNERIAIYRTLSCYMKEHFGDDDLGRKRTWTFLPWHCDFFARYMPLPEETYGSLSVERPLIQSRLVPEKSSPLECLMANRNPKTYDLISAALWESDSDADAVAKLTTLAESHEFQEIQNSKDPSDNSEVKELSNIPKKERKEWRKKRTPKPKRTPEEIIAIRAERAAKRAASGTTYVHNDGARRNYHS